jgi:hypothetical protein
MTKLGEDYIPVKLGKMFKKLSSHFISKTERVTYVILYRVELGIAVDQSAEKDVWV